MSTNPPAPLGDADAAPVDVHDDDVLRRIIADAEDLSDDGAPLISDASAPQTSAEEISWER